MINKIAIRENHINESIANNGIVLINYDAVYPVIDNIDQAVHKKINDLIVQDHKRKIDYLNNAVYPLALRQYDQAQITDRKFVSYNYYLRSTISYNGADFLSFYTDSVLNIRSAESIYNKSSLTFDKNSGELMYMQNLFTKNSRYKEILLSCIAEQIHKNIDSGYNAYYDCWHMEMLKHFNMRNFYLASDGLCIYYEPYIIAGGEPGYQTFEIAYDLLKHVLKSKLEQ